jgi:hypothetical protein
VEQIKDLEKKLKEKEYVDIDTKYRKTQIGIETKKGASKDLDKSFSLPVIHPPFPSRSTLHSSHPRPPPPRVLQSCQHL